MQVNERPGAAVVAVAQSQSVPGNIEANVQRHLRFMQAAASQRAAFLMFPELSLTGYEPALARDLALEPDEPRLQPLRDMARELKIVTVAGAPIRSSITGEVFIAALVFQLDGSLELYYKQHLHSGEETVFSAGVGGAPIDILGERLGLAICADFSQETHARAAAGAGTTLYAVSALISGGGYEHDASLLSGYARTHRMSVLMANHAGTTGGWISGGRSALWSEQGLRIAEIPGAQEGLLIAQRSAHGWTATTCPAPF